MTDSASYTAQVRASDALYPRGGVWLFLGWWAVAAIALLELEPTAAAFEIPALAFADVALVWILRQGGTKSFNADATGLRFWNGTATRRIERALPWSDIQELRLRPILGGTLLEVLLSPGASIEYRTRARQLADLAFMFFVPVTGVRRNVPALVVARPDPPRYQVPLLRVKPAELRDALAEYAPGTPIDMAG